MSTVIKNITLATMADTQLGLIEQAVLVIEGERIAWLGKEQDLPASYLDGVQVYDGQGGLLTPGLIDCHTHLVWGGSRANEFKQRLHGVDYKTIAEQGGGILSTVRATREASEEELFEQTKPKVEALIAQGVTSIEIKSGYGLTLEDELKQLRVARRLGQELPIRVKTTLLAAHAVPPEFKDDADGYIQHIIDVILPAAVEENLVDAVDAFCENIGFTREQTKRLFFAAQEHGLPVKLHAEQLSDQDGASLVAEFAGLSADHLEYLSDKGIEAMSEFDTVAVLLPGAFYFLRETKLPPVEKLRKAGVKIAISTDANPGTSPIVQLPLMMHMACTLFRLTPEEAWLSTTKHAAQALGLSHTGQLAKGMQADLALWDIKQPEELCYEFGIQRLTARWFKGQL